MAGGLRESLSRAAGLVWSGRARVAQSRVRRRSAPREDFIRQHAPGRSFVDVGSMWNVHGEIAFLAETCGATRVTALDVMPATDTFNGEHARRNSSVRFVRGDLHDPAIVETVGAHEVVWCSGVLYHAPNPMLTLAQLRRLTLDRLILATETIPEVPGLRQACVFFPGLGDQQRSVHAFARPAGMALGIHTPFDPGQGYGAWWWGFTRSALLGMLRASGFEIREEHGGPLHATIIASPAEPPPPR